MIPLECRDRLYALFGAALAGKGGFGAAARALAAGRPEWAAYIEDRSRRFEAALRACQTIDSEDPLSRDLRIGAALFNEGLFFDCHEYLEGAWRREQGERKIMVQGLIQAGAALHKLELGSPAGCAELLEKAASKLSSLRDPRWRSLRGFARRLRAARRRVLSLARAGGLRGGAEGKAARGLSAQEFWDQGPRLRIMIQ